MVSVVLGPAIPFTVAMSTAKDVTELKELVEDLQAQAQASKAPVVVRGMAL